MRSFDYATTGTDGESIAVLFVDDDERWAGYVSQELQQYDPSLDVTVAISPNEALQHLRERGAVDCVVTPHGAGSIDGLDVLARVREGRPDLPFLVVADEATERLTERIAAETATECLVPAGDDPIPEYAGKIRSLVGRSRSDRLVAELAEQYEALAGQTDEAVGIVQDGTFVFWNQQLRDLCGYDNSQINTLYPMTDIFHPADREEVRARLDDWYEREGTNEHEARLVTEAGEIRHCELRGEPVAYGDAPALLLSIRDTTERKHRKRELEWETELNRTVQRALVDSQTRTEMEEGICTQLCEYGYELAWTGQVLDDELVPQAVAGDDAIDVASSTFDTNGEGDAAPSVWAARLQEPQFLNDLTNLLEAEWQQTALEAGYRSSAAVPFVYEDVFYGVLVVYHKQFKQFGETERELLSSLADLMAFAIHDIETRQALSSDERVRLELQFYGTEYYLSEIARQSECRSNDPRFTVHRTTRRGDGRTLQYVTVEGVPGGTFRAIAGDHPAVGTVTLIDDGNTNENGNGNGNGAARFELVVDQETPQSRLATLGAVVTETVVRIDGATMTIELPRATDTAETIEQLKESFADVSTESITDSRSPTTAVDRRSPGEIGSLTDKQADALSAAFHHGYFERPRKNTAQEIASTMDISHSTFLQHLRVATQKLLSELYDG